MIHLLKFGHSSEMEVTKIYHFVDSFSMASRHSVRRICLLSRLRLSSYTRQSRLVRMVTPPAFLDLRSRDQATSLNINGGLND